LSVRLTRSFAALLLTSSVFLAGSVAAQNQAQQLPTAATTATVNSDALAVFSEMSRSSEVVRTLAKGDSVYVDLRIDQGGLKWCGIRATAETNRVGFVDCRGLVRTSQPMVLAGSGAAGSAPDGASRTLAAEIPFARPKAPTEGAYAAIKSEVVKEGVIDSGYILTAEAQARTGGPAAVTRAALAHYAAAEFAISQHDLDRAIEHFTAMEPFAGQQRELLYACLVGRGYALLQKSEYSAALDPLSRARKLLPKAATAAMFAGWAHYRVNQPGEAIADLQTAQRLAPTATAAALLEKVQRDKEAEGDFREGESSHFVVRYHGGATHALASEVLRVLEDQFQSLRNELRYAPAEPIVVILYTQEAFRDVTHSPSWVAAMNDGKIRVPVQGLETVSEGLARTLRHELTHIFVSQKTSRRAPTWLQEGLAQWMEGRRSRNNAAALIAFFDQGQLKQLRCYEDSWLRFSADEARYCYAWALAVVETIEVQQGSDAINRLLEAERVEASREAALHEGLRLNLSNLNDATIAYLKTTYPQ